ncbi:MAG: alpha-L-arabinofuranosidase [Sphingobacteriaceae bacterium]|nr:alpha-L-arabinofuranosidase [Sphingobacteriaceae bacterium]
MKKYFFILAFVLALSQAVYAQPVQQVLIQANKPLAKVQPTMWGVFFEDINFSADGGIYAELVKNRSFEFSAPMMAWKEVKQGSASGKILITNRSLASNSNPRVAKISVNASEGAYGLVNEGFRGMGLKKDMQYDFSLFANIEGNSEMKLRVELINYKGEKIGEAEVKGLDKTWKKHTVSIKSNATDPKARLNVLFTGKGIVNIDMISLFPQDTWKNRKGGMRRDLVQLLADLKPGFVRFPGGCIVEGRDLANRYQWKTTVGPVEERTQIINRWNTEFKAPRDAPDYFQSFGLGFYEYFLLSEDIGAEPLPILNCGMACQYNTGEVVAMDQLDPYIQDALDLIEFANGPVTSKWGKLRAEMGHPASFNMKYLGVGNEQWDEQYLERYKAFEKVLSVKHPEIKLASSAGPSPNGPRFDFAWKELKNTQTAMVDEHYYQNPDWFFKNASRYDNYDRNAPKVFAGEYAAHSTQGQEPESRNTWLSALAEAAFMTGLERNADVVHMASYAPLLAHVEAWQWRPDLIWFDNLRSIGTPNYYVQKLFSTNPGTHTVSVTSNGKVLAGQDSLYSSATIDQVKKVLCVKLVNSSSATKKTALDLEGVSAKKPVSVQSLGAANLALFNTLDNPEQVVPVTTTLKASGKSLKVEVKAKSFIVLNIPIG